MDNGQQTLAEKSLIEVRRLTSRFESLEREIETLNDLMAEQLRENKESHRANEPPDDEQPGVQLSGALRAAADCVGTLFKNGLPSSTSDPDLAIALLLAGDGEKYEPTVGTVIRNYREVREEIQKYAGDRDLPKPVRDDIVAGFTRVLERYRHELKLLRVEVAEVVRGTPVDPHLHQVVRKIACRDVASANTVADCIIPLFRWKTALGTERVEAARVIGFERADELAARRKSTPRAHSRSTPATMPRTHR